MAFVHWLSFIGKGLRPMPRQQASYIRDDKYKSWIKRTSSDTKAKCGWCKTEFEIGKMGAAALDSHAKSNKHQDI